MAKKRNSPQKSTTPTKIALPTAGSVSQTDLDFVISLIEAARVRAIASVNTTLIELYWSIGEYISRKTADQG